jgi:hypothetical protein
MFFLFFFGTQQNNNKNGLLPGKMQIEPSGAVVAVAAAASPDVQMFRTRSTRPAVPVRNHGQDRGDRRV